MIPKRSSFLPYYFCLDSVFPDPGIGIEQQAFFHAFLVIYATSRQGVKQLASKNRQFDWYRRVSAKAKESHNEARPRVWRPRRVDRVVR